MTIEPKQATSLQTVESTNCSPLLLLLHRKPEQLKASPENPDKTQQKTLAPLGHQGFDVKKAILK
jgi:hypothetical protein